MGIQKQLSVFLANKPGTLAKMCATLGKAKINILALAVSDTVDHAVVRLVVDHPDRACLLLGDTGALVVENDVLMVELPNRPGELARVASKLAKAKMNIEYAYCTSGETQATGTLLLRVDNPRKALKVLGR
ncbi:MAG: ACT domain-containing protein [Planctomycetes bacterium]|nr:ACT domain-containing protein [Planctomycetota bacterium]